MIQACAGVCGCVRLRWIGLEYSVVFGFGVRLLIKLALTESVVVRAIYQERVLQKGWCQTSGALDGCDWGGPRVSEFNVRYHAGKFIVYRPRY